MRREWNVWHCAVWLHLALSERLLSGHYSRWSLRKAERKTSSSKYCHISVATHILALSQSVWKYPSTLRPSDQKFIWWRKSCIQFCWICLVQIIYNFLFIAGHPKELFELPKQILQQTILSFTQAWVDPGPKSQVATFLVSKCYIQ